MQVNGNTYDYDIKKMVADLFNSGHSYDEIGEACGVTHVTVRTWQRSGRIKKIKDFNAFLDYYRGV